jgi:CheY-like chemotaxis protein
MEDHTPMDSVGGGMPLAGVRVLVVHHYEPLRWLKAHLLRRRGAEVLEASTGTEALELLDAAKVDVALIDCALIDMPAAEVGSRIRENPATAAVPVIYIVASEADRPPPNREAVLQEPVDVDRLASTILAVLGRRSSAEGS